MKGTGSERIFKSV